LIGFLLVILRGWHASNRLRHFIAKLKLVIFNLVSIVTFGNDTVTTAATGGYSHRLYFLDDGSLGQQSHPK